MTTRPELLPACVALMYHPDDAAKYEGKTARTPLFNIEVPMVADEKVDKEKGTGLVMCCTFGDDTDKEWWEKHKLANRVILNKYGKLDPALLAAALGDNAPAALVEAISNKKTSNPDVKNPGARELIIAALKEAALLTDQKPITHAVKCAERSGAPLEILPSEQWFVRIMDKKEALTAKARECNWNPEWMRLRIEQWIDGLSQDWCISRQRYFGVPFPVWYKVEIAANGAYSSEPIYADASQLPVNPLTDLPLGYKAVSKIERDTSLSNAILGIDEKPTNLLFVRAIEVSTGKEVHLVPDYDVMDTWATSSISPQISAGAIKSRHCEEQRDAAIQGQAGGELDCFAGARNDAEESRFQSLFPADLRPQAHEIIRTWAFYTLVKAELHNHQIPWKNLMISGWCLAEDKSKMSKSKGNVVTPVALIEEKGTDAVRYWAGTSRLGQDTAFSPDLLKIGKKLVNKLWNATQFAAIHLEKLDAKPTTAASDVAITEVLDQWILSRLGETVAKATDAFRRYEYADALDATNSFFWADFCDNYLELIKKRVYNEDGSFTSTQQQSAVRALYYCLEGILKLYAAFVPHVTEELYSHIFADDYAAKGSLHARNQWPDAASYPKDKHALEMGTIALMLLEDIRKAKSDAKRSIKTPVTLARIYISSQFLDHKNEVFSLAEDLKGAGNIELLEWQLATNETGSPQVNVTLAAEADAA